MTLVVTKLNERPDRVRSCLDSLVRSSYRNTEILVLIDETSRSSAAVARSYARWDARIRILEQPIQLPVRTGSISANGQYLMVVEASDRLQKRALARLVKVLRLSESDFVVGLVDHGPDEALSASADSGRPHGMDRLGLTIGTCPDHPAADRMTGKLFRYGFLTDLGWTVASAPTIDQRDLVDRAYRWGRFDLVSEDVLVRQDADVPQPGSATDANVTTTSAES